MKKSLDAIVIGAGQSGPPLAVRMGQAGMKVAVVERGLVGGTCVNDGCIPSKTLVASARVAWLARRAADFGVIVGGPVTVDMKKVKARKDAIVAKSRAGVTAWIEDAPNCSLLRGHARFEGPRAVRVGDTVLEAPRVFLDVGGRAAIPDIPGLAEVPFLTNHGILDLEVLPEHLLVLGGSYIGLEFAQMFRRFGSRVTVLEKGDRVAGREDEDVSAALRAILEDEGIAIRTGVDCFRVSRDGGAVALVVRRGEEEERVTGSHLLVATGRRPNTDDLGLDAAGVVTDARGYVRVDDQLRTNVEGIWAMGDANGRGAFTHTSYADFQLVAANLLDGEQRTLRDRIPAYALYTDPPLGRVGMTEAQARQSGRRVQVGRLDMERVGRARERSETAGFMKVLVDADSRRILGASLLGIEADEVVHLLLDAMAADAPYTVVARAMHIHPTVAELIPTLLEKLEPLA